jgi:hypothetical protein
MKHLRYIGYVLTLKTRVFVHALILGVPVRGLLHDLSKLSPIEWKGIGRQFYPSTPEEKDANASLFRQAKAHHRARNRHEVDHWYHDDGPCSPIPPAILKEIMADWGAFGGLCFTRAAIRHQASLCYQKWGKNYKMHPDTREWIERFLGTGSQREPRTRR